MKYTIKNREGTVSYDYEFICDALVGMYLFNMAGIVMYLNREEE